MEMQIDANLLKRERNKRAWSQEHLAQVTGLGLRTIQRIESSGMASNESIASIATVLEMTVADLLSEGHEKAPDGQTGAFQKYRLPLVLAIVAVAQVFSPPQLGVALACLWLWVVFELSTFISSKRSQPKST